MNITKLTEADLPALASLYTQFWGEESSVDKMQSTFAKLKDNPDYTFLAARLDDQIVGSVMGVVCHELYGDCKPFMIVEDMIVDRTVRRQGPARERLDPALQHRPEQGQALEPGAGLPDAVDRARAASRRQ